MPTLDFSPKAAETVRGLPRDAVLLRRLWRWFERIAEDPQTHTEPTCFPYPPGRLMANTAIEDGQRVTWGATAVLRVNETDSAMHVLVLNIAPAPYLDDPDLNPDPPG